MTLPELKHHTERQQQDASTILQLIEHIERLQEENRKLQEELNKRGVKQAEPAK